MTTTAASTKPRSSTSDARPAGTTTQIPASPVGELPAFGAREMNDEVARRDRILRSLRDCAARAGMNQGRLWCLAEAGALAIHGSGDRPSIQA